jgi:hypothetical protein
MAEEAPEQLAESLLAFLAQCQPNGVETGP